MSASLALFCISFSNFSIPFPSFSYISKLFKCSFVLHVFGISSVYPFFVKAIYIPISLDYWLESGSRNVFVKKSVVDGYILLLKWLFQQQYINWIRKLHFLFLNQQRWILHSMMKGCGNALMKCCVSVPNFHTYRNKNF